MGWKKKLKDWRDFFLANMALLTIFLIIIIHSIESLILDGQVTYEDEKGYTINRPGMNLIIGSLWNSSKMDMWNGVISPSVNTSNPALLIKSDVGPANQYLQLLLNIGAETINITNGEDCLNFQPRYGGTLANTNRVLDAAMINLFLSNIDSKKCVWFYSHPGSLTNLPVVTNSLFIAMFGQNFTKAYSKHEIGSMNEYCFCLYIYSFPYFPPVFPVIVRRAKAAIPLRRNTPNGLTNDSSLTINNWMIRSTTDGEIWFLSFDPWCLESKGNNGRELNKNVLSRIKVKNYDDYLRLFSLAVGLRDFRNKNLFPFVLVPAPISTQWSEDHTIVDPSATNNEILWAINIWTGHFRPLISKIFPAWNKRESRVFLPRYNDPSLFVWGCVSKSRPVYYFPKKESQTPLVKHTNNNHSTVMNVVIGFVCVLGTVILVGIIYVILKLKKRM